MNYLWPAILCGPKTGDHLLRAYGGYFLVSIGRERTRFYDCEILARDVSKYAGADVFDCHHLMFPLQPYRSKLGRVVNPFWCGHTHEVRGYIEIQNQIVQEQLEALAIRGELHTIGLSHDIKGRFLNLRLGDRKREFLAEILKVGSVDLCAQADAGTGGRFLDMKEWKTFVPHVVRIKDSLGIIRRPRGPVRTREYFSITLRPHIRTMEASK